MADVEESLGVKSLTENKGLMNKLFLSLGIAATIAIMTGTWLWSQKPEYKVLFSNFNDKDGGAIVDALDQMNIPYEFSNGGSAILIPSEQVHNARLKIASMGIPKGGNVGFELLENQKFGVSQFVEQVNFQRGLEGELEKSIQAIDSVDAARVHLAIPKGTVFVREKQKPTASVLLNLRSGRSLDEKQVSAIVHLVASSVPDLPISNVTVVDQVGNLLSDTKPKAGAKNLDATQLKYIEDIQQGIIKRVESILIPLVGQENVHAQASAEIDFSTTEQADELYKPNQAPEFSVVRSQQTSESISTSGGASGVPGALSNQPPAPSTAPIDGQAESSQQTTPINSEKNSTTNYEVDKTVRYSQQSMGGLKRLTVAVIVNNKQVKDKNGKVTSVPLTEAEKTQIRDLARDAMGFKQERGDSLSVVNYSFAGVQPEIIPETPVWKDPDNIDMAKNALKTLLGLIVLFMLYRKVLKPLVNKLVSPEKKESPVDSDGVSVSISGDSPVEQEDKSKSYQQNLGSAKQLAKDNPKMVAALMTGWVNGDE